MNCTLKVPLSKFTHSIDSNIYYNPNNGREFIYSDGESIEKKICKDIEAVKDLTDGSKELTKKIINWPSNYHLGPGRANILRILKLPKNAKVLELGSGCGAITRYLGEQGCYVDAIEGSYTRAEITRKRCRDLTNVNVYCSEFSLINFEKKYDFVLLVGVLEYAPKYFNFKNEKKEPKEACQSLLEIADSALKSNGILVLAIENRIGLKYWSGCPEDHTGVLYDGLHGYPGVNMPTTWSKYELNNILLEAGFNESQWFYCFPDYKFASTIISDNSIIKPADFYLHNWVSTPFREFGQPRIHTFNEKLVLKTLSKANLIREFANSFLVVASKTTGSIVKTDWLVKSFNTNRLKKYACETTLLIKPEFIVKKNKLYNDEDKSEFIIDGEKKLIQEIHEITSWYPGDLLSYKLLSIIYFREKDKAKQTTDLIDELKKYYIYIKNNFGIGSKDIEGYELLNGRALDCLPSNIIVQADGSLVSFDLEWRIDDNIPVDYILYRAIQNDINAQLPEYKKCNIYKIIKFFFPFYSKLRHNHNENIETKLQRNINVLPAGIWTNKHIGKFRYNKFVKKIWSILPYKMKNVVKKILS